MQTVNPAFTQVCGYRIEEILGKNINLLASVKHSKDFYPKLWRYLQQHNPWQGELWHQHKKGKASCWPKTKPLPRHLR